MAKSHFNLNKFRTEILSGQGLARTNRFEVIIPPPRALSIDYKDEAALASLYVEAANIPLLNIFAKSFKIFGPSYQRPITSEYGGEGISMSFHVDRKMNVRRFFEDWMHTIINPNNYTVGYAEDYVTDIKIRQINEQDDITYEVTLIDAFPRNINLMDLNHSSSNQTHRLNVLFAYRYWVREPKVKQPTDVPLPISYPGVPRTDVRTDTPNKQNKLNNVLPTGQQDYSQTNQDMAFGVSGLTG